MSNRKNYGIESQELSQTLADTTLDHEHSANIYENQDVTPLPFSNREREIAALPEASSSKTPTADISAIAYEAFTLHEGTPFASKASKVKGKAKATGLEKLDAASKKWSALQQQITDLTASVSDLQRQLAESKQTFLEATGIRQEEFLPLFVNAHNAVRNGTAPDQALTNAFVDTPVILNHAHLIRDYTDTYAAGIGTADRSGIVKNIAYRINKVSKTPPVNVTATTPLLLTLDQAAEIVRQGGGQDAVNAVVPNPALQDIPDIIRQRIPTNPDGSLRCRMAADAKTHIKGDNIIGIDRTAGSGALYVLDPSQNHVLRVPEARLISSGINTASLQAEIADKTAGRIPKIKSFSVSSVEDINRQSGKKARKTGIFGKTKL